MSIFHSKLLCKLLYKYIKTNFDRWLLAMRLLVFDGYDMQKFWEIINIWFNFFLEGSEEFSRPLGHGFQQFYFFVGSSLALSLCRFLITLLIGHFLYVVAMLCSCHLWICYWPCSCPQLSVNRTKPAKKLLSFPLYWGREGGERGRSLSCLLSMISLDLKPKY